MSKSYVDGKVARFDGCEADTWSPLWLTDFMQQLGYPEPKKYVLYWLLPGMNLDTGLRIVDSDTDTLNMIVVVPKLQYFQLYVDHKDLQFDNAMLDDVVICGSPDLPPVLSPGKRMDKAAAGRSNVGSSNSVLPRQEHNVRHELGRSRRQLDVEEEAKNYIDSDSDDSDWDADWVDSDNELAADDDDLYEEWVDDKFEKRMSKSKWEEDSDYDTDVDLKELQDSDVEEHDSVEEV
uniref:Uncharacterized protein n=1 Tax=Avena sativa TaxID=4498 RepID=A0ACD5XTH7_AVESA